MEILSSGEIMKYQVGDIILMKDGEVALITLKQENTNLNFINWSLGTKGLYSDREITLWIKSYGAKHYPVKE